MSTPSSHSPVLPEQFGPYRILRPLGKGGMGAVYLARDTRLDREIALKVCRLADNPQAQERFRREAKAAASLSHQYLCPVYEYDVRDGIAYLTMAFIKGETLNAWLEHHAQPSQQEAALLVAKLALAMQSAHEAGVIHRDLKPCNVAINQKDEPIILDFGLAQQFDDAGTRLTKQGAINGTPSYMAPEQACGDLEQIGPACDIYALGVILYELLTGQVPFQGSTMAVLSQLLHATPMPVRARNPSVDSAVEAICMKALAKKPTDRPRSMKELANELVKVTRATRAAAGIANPVPLPAVAGHAATQPKRVQSLHSLNKPEDSQILSLSAHPLGACFVTRGSYPGQWFAKTPDPGKESSCLNLPSRPRPRQWPPPTISRTFSPGCCRRSWHCSPSSRLFASNHPPQSLPAPWKTASRRRCAKPAVSSSSTSTTASNLPVATTSPCGCVARRGVSASAQEPQPDRHAVRRNRAAPLFVRSR